MPLGGRTSDAKYDSIQYLRAIAATLVVIFHASSIALADPNDDFPFKWAQSGVDIFFVISGFVMWVSTFGRATRPHDFYWNRIRRIVPLYWLMTSLVVAIGVAAPGLLRSAKLELPHVAASYLFIGWPSPAAGAEGQVFPLLIVGWSLNQEMFFYLLFGIMLLLPARWRGPVTVATFLSVTLAGLLIQPTAIVAQFYLSTKAAEFGAGVALGAVVTGSRVRPPAVVAVGVAAIGFVLLPLSYAFFEFGAGRELLLAFAALLVTSGSIGLERSGRLPALPSFEEIGKASYSLYLTHPLLLSALASVVLRHGAPDTFATGWGFVVVAVISALAFSILVFRWVERPLTARLSAWGRRNRDPAEAPRRPVD